MLAIHLIHPQYIYFPYVFPTFKAELKQLAWRNAP